MERPDESSFVSTGDIFGYWLAAVSSLLEFYSCTGMYHLEMRIVFSEPD